MRRSVKSIVLGTVCACALVTSAVAQTSTVEISSGDLKAAIDKYAQQTGVQVIYNPDDLAGRKTAGVHGTVTQDQALSQILAGTDLAIKREPGGAIGIAKADESKNVKAASNEAAPTPVESVIVTGTHIRGGENIGTHLQTITRDDIDRSGYSTVESLVASIPQNFSDVAGQTFTGAPGNVIAAQNVDYISSIDLRGLGPQSTLTPIDGKRVARSDQGQAVDVSAIPLGMIDHIDVLTDANSAIYGADAVGGVVNFVLKHKFDGAQTDAYAGMSDHGGYRVDFSQIVGSTFDNGGFVLGYDYARDKPFNLVSAGRTSPSAYGFVLATLPSGADSERHSIYLSGEYAPAGSIQFYGDASFVWHELDVHTDENYPSYPLRSVASNNVVNNAGNVVAGVRADLSADWQLDISGNYSHASIGTTSNSEYSGLFSESYPYSDRSATSTYSGSAVLNGPVSLLGTSGKVALGVEFRRETLNSTTFVSTNILGGSTPQVDAGRSITSAFAEYEARLLDGSGASPIGDLELSLAARYDHYSDFGEAASPQAGLKWTPIDGLIVRGFGARAFRAPDLWTLYDGTAKYLDPIDVCASSTCSTTPTLLLEQGNPSLHSETATTASVGIEAQPQIARWLEGSISYNEISYKNRIQQPIAVLSPLQAANYPGFVFVHPSAAQAAYYLGLPGNQFSNSLGVPFDPASQSLLGAFPNLAIADDRYANVAAIQLNALDFSVKAAFETDDANAYTFSVNGTYTVKSTETATPGAPPVSLVDQVELPSALRMRGALNWTHGAFVSSLFFNYVDGYQNQYTTPASKMPPWVTVDATIVIDASQFFADQWSSGLRLIVSGQNIFNEPPPFLNGSITGVNYDGANANGMGRYLAIRISKEW